MAVVVVTDSSASLSRNECSEWGIEQVGLHVLVGERDYLDGVDELPADVLDADAVTTAGASAEDLRDAYAQALDRSEGDGVIAVHLSRALSSTWEAARTAASALGPAVRVVDSHTVGLGLGFGALAAARAARDGGGLDDVYIAANRVASHTRTFVAVEQLDNLRRSGRISSAAAWVGTALSLKPVLHTVGGKLVLKERARTASKAQSSLLACARGAIEELAGHGRLRIGVQHASAPERAEMVAAELAEADCDVTVRELCSVISVHVGKGAVGVVISAD